MMRVVHIETAQIFVPEGRRAVDKDKVDQIAESIAKVGMLQPITVAYEGGRIRLVAGAHRLAAAKRLRWSEVPAVVALGDAVELRLVEIAENLHRAELTALERDELLAEWIRLTEGVSSQVETKPQEGRPEGGVSAAARELGVSKSKASRATFRKRKAAFGMHSCRRAHALLSLKPRTAGSATASLCSKPLTVLKPDRRRP